MKRVCPTCARREVQIRSERAELARLARMAERERTLPTMVIQYREKIAHQKAVIKDAVAHLETHRAECGVLV